MIITVFQSLHNKDRESRKTPDTDGERKRCSGEQGEGGDKVTAGPREFLMPL